MRHFDYYVSDFETTVYMNQKNTEVWCGGIANIEDYSDTVFIYHSIEGFFTYIKRAKQDMYIYFHNVKFDGSFIIDYLLRKGWEQAMYKDEIDGHLRFSKQTKLRHKQFTYLISSMGIWYNITLRWKNHIIIIVDSLKLLPMSLKELCKAFKTKHQKLEMEYEGNRYAGCPITEDEKQYLQNDVLALKECMQIMFEQGHTQLTIGSCCIKEFKHEFTKTQWDTLFPNLYELKINEDEYGSESIGEYIHNSYHGGWCYVKEDRQSKVINNGCTLDVNSLYPSMMCSESGNRYPVGQPIPFKGKIPEEAKANDKYFFVRIRCSFKLREGKLPFIQIKGNLWYKGNEMLKTSDIYDKRTGKYITHILKDGKMERHTVKLTLTQTDYYLFLEHYEVENFEILDGMYFNSVIGIFDSYIYKYMEQKKKGKGATRTIPKLYLNNLYGRFAMYVDSSFKVAQLIDGEVKFKTVSEREKKPGYIPIGSAITSYSRNFTIRHAQANYETFCYADTDSIHLSGSKEKAKMVKLHDSNLCCWKNEMEWDKAIFARQKTYIEINDNEFNIKCCGMNDKCKHIIELAYDVENGKNVSREILSNYNEIQQNFILHGFKLTDFKRGLKVFGNLKQKRIIGGVVLYEDFYEMR